jgi:hypothetical protein
MQLVYILLTALNNTHFVYNPLSDRRYRIRGLAKNLAFDVLMKVNVLIERGDAFHVDTLDLYSVRARTLWITQAARELTSPRT